MSAKAAFGQTGHESTRTIFGAAALAAVSPNEAAATLEVLLEYGVNHIDTAASYGDSELPGRTVADAPQRPVLSRDEDRKA
jgi:aryl-alcohol dehydrogenase-like predicted oxidoreductase